MGSKAADGSWSTTGSGTLTGYWSLPASGRVPVGVAFCDQYDDTAPSTIDLTSWNGAPSLSGQFGVLDTWSSCGQQGDISSEVGFNNQIVGIKSNGGSHMMYPTSLGACGTDTKTKALKGPTIALIRLGMLSFPAFVFSSVSAC
jgi:hypothetical protein